MNHTSSTSLEKQQNERDFEMLVKAAKQDEIFLIWCEDVATGKTVPTLCLFERLDDGGIRALPIGKLFTTKPYGEIKPPEGKSEGIKVLAPPIPSKPESTWIKLQRLLRWLGGVRNPQ